MLASAAVTPPLYGGSAAILPGHVHMHDLQSYTFSAPEIASDVYSTQDDLPALHWQGADRVRSVSTGTHRRRPVGADGSDDVKLFTNASASYIGLPRMDVTASGNRQTEDVAADVYTHQKVGSGSVAHHDASCDRFYRGRPCEGPNKAQQGPMAVATAQVVRRLNAQDAKATVANGGQAGESAVVVTADDDDDDGTDTQQDEGYTAHGETQQSVEGEETRTHTSVDVRTETGRDLSRRSRTLHKRIQRRGASERRALAHTSASTKLIHAALLVVATAALMLVVVLPLLHKVGTLNPKSVFSGWRGGSLQKSGTEERQKNQQGERATADIGGKGPRAWTASMLRILATRAAVLAAALSRSEAPRQAEKTDSSGTHSAATAPASQAEVQQDREVGRGPGTASGRPQGQPAGEDGESKTASSPERQATDSEPSAAPSRQDLDAPPAALSVPLISPRPPPTESAAGADTSEGWTQPQGEALEGPPPQGRPGRRWFFFKAPSGPTRSPLSIYRAEPDVFGLVSPTPREQQEALKRMRQQEEAETRRRQEEKERAEARRQALVLVEQKKIEEKEKESLARAREQRPSTAREMNFDILSLTKEKHQ